MPIVIKGGRFADIHGDYHHHDYTQRTTNIDSYNVIGNDIENVGNSGTQTIYRERNAPSTSRGRFTNDRTTTSDANGASTKSPSLPDDTVNAPQPQKLGDGSNGFPTNSASQAESLPQCKNLDSAGKVSMEVVPFSVQSQSITAGLQCLTLNDERASQPKTSGSHTGATSNQDQAVRYPGLRNLRQRILNATSAVTGSLHRTTAPTIVAPDIESATNPTPTQPLSSSATKIDEPGPKHIVIKGDYTWVDRSVHELNVNSHNVTGNVVKDSFNKKDEVIVQKNKSHRQGRVPKKRKV